MIVSNRPDPTISPAEEPPGDLERTAAVAHARLLLVGELVERATERRVEEHRVVAEAPAPTRRLRDHAFDDSLDDLLSTRRAHQGDHAAEARGPLRWRHVTEPLEQEPRTPPVVEPRAAEPRCVEPGRARERVDLEPGVVAERERTRQARSGVRLSECVLGVGPPGLFRQAGPGKLGEKPDPERYGAEECLQLAALGGIERGEDENRARG